MSATSDDPPPSAGAPDELPGAITQLLRQLGAGDPSAAERLTELVYPELRRLAAAHRRRERANHSLEPTELVNEAYLRLFAGKPLALNDRQHLFAAFARAMRQVLVDHARKRGSAKRGAGQVCVTLGDETQRASSGRDVDVLALHESLERLAELSARQAQVVELRFFGGLSIPETAAALGIGKTQVSNDWSVAKAWLQAELSGLA